MKRRTRSDKGKRKPHPAGCRHCAMVEEYRLLRQSQLDNLNWRDETAYSRVITFKQWLKVYRYEQETAA